MENTFTNPGRNTFTHEQLHKFAYDILDHKASMIDYPEFQIEDLIVGDTLEPIPFEEAINYFDMTADWEQIFLISKALYADILQYEDRNK